VDGQVARPAVADDLAETLLAVLVELPPPAMERVVQGIVSALARTGAGATGPFVQQCSRAMARFAVPQWMRVKDHFERASAAAGLDVAW
jgi:hypothetical protein